jgi:hypothetical protein
MAQTYPQSREIFLLKLLIIKFFLALNCSLKVFFINIFHNKKEREEKWQTGQ